MALTKCKECKHEISKDAFTCPYCGKPQKKQSKGNGCGAVILIAAIIAVISVMNKTPQGTQAVAPPPKSTTPPAPAAGASVKTNNEEHPVSTVLTAMPSRPIEPQWEERLAYWRVHYAKEFITPIIGQQIDFVLQGGIGKQGRLMALSPDSLTIEIANGSLAFDRKGIRQDSRVKLFEVDYTEDRALKEVAKEKNTYAKIVRKYEADIAEARLAEAERHRSEQRAARQQQFVKLFDEIDGSLPTLVLYTMNSMNDPKSFDHIETRYSIDGDNFVVRMEFRGKNAFGGLVKNAITARVAANGNILQVISTDY